MLATLPTATTQPNGFSVTNLLAALVFVLLFWLFQRWLRDRVSKRRRERWAREEGRSPVDPDGETGGTDGTGDSSGPDASGPDDPTRR